MYDFIQEGRLVAVWMAVPRLEAGKPGVVQMRSDQGSSQSVALEAGPVWPVLDAVWMCGVRGGEEPGGSQRWGLSARGGFCRFPTRQCWWLLGERHRRGWKGG